LIDTMRSAMGSFLHPITIIGTNGRSETLNAVVDSEQLFAVIPYGVLSRLDVWPDRSISHKGQERGFARCAANFSTGRARSLISSGQRTTRLASVVTRLTRSCWMWTKRTISLFPR